MKCDYCDELSALATLVCNGLSYPSKRARLVCLHFTSILLTHSPAASSGSSFSLSLFRSSLLQAITDNHDEVIEVAVKVLLQYAQRMDDLEGVLRDVIRVSLSGGSEMKILQESTEVMEKRGSFLLCMLCKYEESTTVYPTIARILRVGVGADAES